MRDMVQIRRSRNRFADEPQARIGRSQFNRSHGLKTMFDASYLTPIFLDEVLPGDTFTMRLNGFARVFSPLDSPIMDNIELETFFFFVPCRLVWEHWEDFNGAHDAAGAQDTDYTIPRLGGGFDANHDGGGSTEDYLGGYLGLPHGADSDNININALPFRCYNLIYSTWFRDQNLIDEPTLNVDDGPDTVADYALLKSAKKHDYFTSALPYLQKGDEVTIAIDSQLPVLGIGKEDATYAGTTGLYHESDGNRPTYATYTEIDPAAAGSTYAVEEGGDRFGVAGNPGIYAETDGYLEISVNAMRESVAIQRLLEKDARGGTRYVELIKAHFGVTSPDYRLQRPEFLGGGKSFINVSPVANTSDTATVEQGELKGIGTGVLSGHGWAKSFTEHGYILGLVRARGDITYFQGLDKIWTRSTRYDFYIPALANLGEQSILNQEIWCSNNPTTDRTTWAYQERWAEYRYKPSKITGKLNPDAAGALSHWHLAEDFAALPSLNQTFIEDATPMDRVTTITTEPHFIMDVWFDFKCARPMPVHSIPSLTGRF